MENALAMVTANTHPRLMLPMFLEADDALFRKILHDKAHVLHSFLSDRPDIVYSLRSRSHNKSLMCKTSDLNERNFLVSVIYKDCY